MSRGHGVFVFFILENEFVKCHCSCESQLMLTLKSEPKPNLKYGYARHCKMISLNVLNMYICDPVLSSMH